MTAVARLATGTEVPLWSGRGIVNPLLEYDAHRHRLCLVCGAAFIAKRPISTCCSPAHTKIAAKRRSRQRKAASAT